MAEKMSDDEKNYKDKRAEDLKGREEAQRMMDEAVPTPTQEEVDMAVLSIAAGRGAPLTSKSGDEAAAKSADEAAKKRAAEASGTASYQTRAAEPAKKV